MKGGVGSGLDFKMHVMEDGNKTVHICHARNDTCTVDKEHGSGSKISTVPLKCLTAEIEMSEGLEMFYKCMFCQKSGTKIDIACVISLNDPFPLPTLTNHSDLQ